MYAAAGLYYNFGKIVFNKGTSPSSNVGGFIKVNGKESGSLTIAEGSTNSEFVTGNATEVHNLTMYELNQVRNKKAGTNSFALNQTDGTSSYDQLTTANDAATGLFKLSDLNSAYSSKSAYYWLASPIFGYASYVWNVCYDGGFNSGSNTALGVRLVVLLTTVSTSDIVGN